MSATPEISVILPGYNEAGNIETMVAQVRAALDPLGRKYEVIWVDDGSTDDSHSILDRVVQTAPELRVLAHDRNYGQSAALLTGFLNARSELVITMDSDLQNDPADLPAMLQLLEREKYDAVCGIRQNRQDTRLKRVSSKVANLLRRLALQDHISDAGCALRVIRRDALQQLPAFRALHRFLPTILQIHGYEVGQMPVRHRPRGAGVSHYGVGNRLWVGIVDIMGIRWYRKRFLPPHRVRS